MERKRVEGLRWHFLAICIAIGAVVAPSSYAGIEIADMQFSFNTAQFYEGDTQTFSFDEPVQGLGLINILTSETETDWEYEVHGGTATLSSSAYSPGDGTFAGSITLTITGTVKDQSANTVASGTLIEATMVETSWSFNQLSSTTLISDPPVTFEATGGALFGEENGSGIYIDQFSMYFLATTVLDFDGFDADDASGLVRMQMETDAFVPEPATLALLSLGTVVLARKRRQNA